MAIAPIFNNNWWNTPVRMWSIIPWWGTVSWVVNWQDNPQVSPFLVPWNTLPARQTLLWQADKATALWMPEVTNYLTSLVSDLASRDTTNKWIYDLYSAFWNNLYGMMDDRNSFYGSLNQDVLGKLATLQKQYQDTYGPQWQMMQKANQLYGNYGNYLLNKNASDRAFASWAASKYWLSDNARRIAENDVWLQWLSEALKIFDAETQSLDNINKTFNTLTTDAFGKYKWVQDDYLKSLYDSNFWVQTQLAQWLLNLLSNNEQLKNQMKLQQQYSWGWTSSKSTSTSSWTTSTWTQTPQWWQTEQPQQTRYIAVASVATQWGPGVQAMWSDWKMRIFPQSQYNELVKQWTAK